jgi:hypothetical protein
MSNLIPEVRADRNGKLVTRHVKADSSASASSLSLPAPKVKKEPGKRQRINYIVTSVRSAYDNHVEEIMSFYGEEASYDDEKDRVSALVPRTDKLDYALCKLPASTVEHIAQKIMNSGFESEFQMILPDIVHEGRTASDVNLFTYLHGHSDVPSYDDEVFVEEVSTYQLLRTMVDGLNGYKHLGYEPPSNIFDASEDDQSMVLSLCKMRFAQPVDDEYDVMSLPDSVKNDALVKLMLNNPDKAERVVELMRERETDDAGLIGSIIESESQAVSNGHL